jgi:hypothetical protein
MQSSTDISTTSGQRYLVQLCKHFSHRLPASWDDGGGCIEFPFGTCNLKAGPDALSVGVEAASEADLDRMEHVVLSHLQRFAFREELAAAWVRDRAKDPLPGLRPDFPQRGQILES